MYYFFKFTAFSRAKVLIFIMHKKFLSYIKSEKLFTRKNKLLVAASGGLDSMCLCEMLRINRFNFAVAHFNHVTRNGASDLDESFVSKYAEKYGIPFYSERVDIQSVINKNKAGNFQSIARENRYRFFISIKEQHAYDFILTAHHHNDQIETFLFHFSRGTGLDGLTGIANKEKCVIRPLLCFNRNELERFAMTNNIPYQVDVSNNDSKYARNYIRHAIIPSFKLLNENFEQNANNTIENLRDSRLLYHYILKKYAEPFICKNDQTGYIYYKTGIFSSNKNLNEQLCFELFKPYGFNFDQCSQIINSLEIKGKHFISENYVLLVDQQQLVLKSIDPVLHFSYCIASGITQTPMGKLILTSVKGIKAGDETNPNIEYIDGQNITETLIIRTKQDGDRFRPFGMGGKTKKLSDYLIDSKINRFEKEKVVVLVHKQTIVWVLGYRLSDEFKVSENTKEFIKLEWHPFGKN